MQAASDERSDSDISSTVPVPQLPASDVVDCVESNPEAPSHNSSVMSDHRQSSSTAGEEKGTNVNTRSEDACLVQENENDNCSGELDDGDNASEISDFSNFSQESWQPVQGPIAWVQEQMRQGQSPRKILEDLVPSGTVIPEGLDPIMLWKIIINIVSEPPKRKKLHDINTLDDVLQLLNTCKKIIVLTGAGVSVSCGIPDFRSRDGVYARLAKDFPNLPDPQAMFDIHFFRNDPRPFFKFAKEIYPGQFRPSPCHHFIKLLEDKGKLLRNYTQNIDTLEQVAGIQRVIQCHGSFATATCAACGHKVDSDAIKADIFNQVIPHCPRCSPSNQGAVMKPDIVFFGESLPEHFHNQMAQDKDECDLLIVIGSSLKVRPVALIPNSLPANVPQVLINRERLHYLNFDVELLGNCDDIVGELCRRLGPGWEQLAAPGPPLSEVILSNLPTPPVSPQSGESRDRWDDSSNAAVSSSEGNLHSKVKPVPAFSSVSKQDEKEVPQVCETSVKTSEIVRPEDDGGVPEVTTSQSEPSLAKPQKGSHHRHTVKRPFSFLGASSKDDSTSSDQSSKFPEADQTGNDLYSPQEVKTLVSECHKRDVMYMPNEKSTHSHHGQSASHAHHSQHSHSHHHHHHCQLPAHEMPKTSSHHHQPSHSSLSETQCSSSGVPHQTSAQELTVSHSSSQEPSTGSTSLCSSKVVEADSQKQENDDATCSDSKRPRLCISPEPDTEEGAQTDRNDNSNGPDEDRKDTSDSLSQEGSLEDIRKMWRSKRRISLAQRLAENQVLFMPPSRYVFKGAEVFSESESEDSDEDDDDDDDDSSVGSDVGDVPENAMDSSNNSNVPENAVDSTFVTSATAGDKLTTSSDTISPTTFHTLNDVDVASSSAASESVIQNTHSPITDSSLISEVNPAQPSECSRNINIPSVTSLTDNSTSCPVSSTDDLLAEQSTENNSAAPSLQL